MQKIEKIVRTSDGFELSLWVEYEGEMNSNRRCVVLSHGITVDKTEFNKHLNIFDVLSERLVKAGYVVARFDSRGHGESSGTEMDYTVKSGIVDLESIIDYLEKEYDFTEFDLLAASFSGGAAAYFVSGNRELIRSVIFWNSLLNYRRLYDPKIQWGSAHWGNEAYETAKKVGYAEIGSRKLKYSVELLDQTRELKPWEKIIEVDIPMLFIHGDKDIKVKVDDSIEYSKLVKKGELLVIEGAEHGFDNKQYLDVACEAVIAFLDRRSE